jgi:hypothetical protein
LSSSNRRYHKSHWKESSSSSSKCYSQICRIRGVNQSDISSNRLDDDDDDDGDIIIAIDSTGIKATNREALSGYKNRNSRLKRRMAI